MVRIFSYSNKVTALVLVLTVVPVFVMGSYMYSDKINHEKYDMQEKLGLITATGANNIAVSLEEQKNTIRNIASDQLVVTETKNLLVNNSADDAFRSQFTLVKQFSTSLQNNNWLKQLVISNLYTGDVIFHTGLDFPEGNLKDKKHFQDAANGKIGVSEIYQSARYLQNEYGEYEQGVPTLLISAPISGEVGAEAVLTARVDAFTMMYGVTPQLYGFAAIDAYLVNSEGYFLSKPAFYENILDLNSGIKRTELELQITDPRSNQFTKIFQLADENGIVWDIDGYNNYIGNSVIGAITQPRDTNWYYIVEVDRNEAYEGIVTIQRTLFLSIAIAILIIVFISFAFARRLINPIKKLTVVTETIGEGNLDVEIDSKIKRRRDEIGQLAERFDKMRSNIKSMRLARENANSNLRSDRKALKKLAETLEEQNIKLQRLNQELKTEKLKYSELYESSPDLYRTVDKNGIILNCNRSYAEYLGYSKEEVIGKSIFEHVSDESIDAIRVSLETWQRYGRVVNREVIMKRKDGSTFPALISATNLYDEYGKLIGSNTVIRDISEIYELKSKTEKLEEINYAKEEFSSMITHELKTPLVPILLYCELLLDEKLGNLPPKQRDKIRIIYDSAKSLSALIQDILDVHKLELGKMKFDMRKTNAKELIDKCIVMFEPLAQSKNIKLISEADALAIRCDPERITQVLTNLVGNAIKFVPANDGRVVISAVQHDSSVIFSVKDNGIGIPKQQQQELFKKFYQVDMSNTRKPGGSGLGLVICKGIVEAHNGRIWCKSEKGKGSTFFFSIPITTESEVVERCQV